MQQLRILSHKSGYMFVRRTPIVYADRQIMVIVHQISGTFRSKLLLNDNWQQTLEAKKIWWKQRCVRWVFSSVTFPVNNIHINADCKMRSYNRTINFCLYRRKLIKIKLCERVGIVNTLSNIDVWFFFLRPFFIFLSIHTFNQMIALSYLKLYAQTISQ